MFGHFYTVDYAYVACPRPWLLSDFVLTIMVTEWSCLMLMISELVSSQSTEHQGLAVRGGLLAARLPSSFSLLPT